MLVLGTPAPKVFLVAVRRASGGAPTPRPGRGQGRLPGSRPVTPLSGDRSGQGPGGKAGTGQSQHPDCGPSGAQRTGLGAPSTVGACPLEDGTLRPLAVGDRVGQATAVSGVGFPGSPGASSHLQRDLSGGTQPSRGSHADTVPPTLPRQPVTWPAWRSSWPAGPAPRGPPQPALESDHGLQPARSPGAPADRPRTEQGLVPRPVGRQAALWSCRVTSGVKETPLDFPSGHGAGVWPAPRPPPLALLWAPEA